MGFEAGLVGRGSGQWGCAAGPACWQGSPHGVLEQAELALADVTPILLAPPLLPLQPCARFFDTSNVRRPRGHSEAVQQGALPSRSPALMSGAGSARHCHCFCPCMTSPLLPTACTRSSLVHALPAAPLLPPPIVHLTLPPLSSLAVEGRTHSVQVHYLEAPAADYIQAAVETTVNLHKEDLPGDVLLFLTGQDECEAGERGGRRKSGRGGGWRCGKGMCALHAAVKRCVFGAGAALLSRK